ARFPALLEAAEPLAGHRRPRPLGDLRHLLGQLTRLGVEDAEVRGLRASPAIAIALDVRYLDAGSVGAAALVELGQYTSAEVLQALVVGRRHFQGTARLLFQVGPGQTAGRGLVQLIRDLFQDAVGPAFATGRNRGCIDFLRLLEEVAGFLVVPGGKGFL